jgi:hypothetical protein
MADENLDMFGNPIESVSDQEEDKKLDMFGNTIEQTIKMEKENPSSDEVNTMLNEVATQGYANPTSDKGPQMSASIEYDPDLVGDNVPGVNKPTSYPTINLSLFNRLGDLAKSMSDEDFSVLNLPPPNSKMYEGLDFSEADALYRKYLIHPNTSGMGYNYTNPKTGEKTKNFIPEPKQDLPFMGTIPTTIPFETKADVGLSDIVTLGITNAVGNIAETAGMLIDWGSLVIGNDEWEKENPEGLGINKYIKEKYPYLKTEGIDSLYADTIPLITGGVIGKKTIDGVLEYGPKLPGLVQNTLRFAGFDAGVSASVDEDLGGLLIGSDPKQKLINLDSWTGGLTKGIEVDPSSPEWEQAMAKRTNIFLDGLIASGLAQKGIEGVGGVSKLFYGFAIKPMVTPFSKQSKEDAIVATMMDNILQVIGKSSDDAEAVAGISRLINDNKEAFSTILKSLDNKEVEIGLSTMDALDQGLRNIDLTKYPELNINASDVRRLQSNAQGVNKAGEQFTGGKLSDVRAGPTREIEEITDLIEDAAGGSTSVKSGFESIQDAGTLEIQTVRNNVDDLTKRLEVAKGDIELLIKNDPELGPKLKALSELEEFNFSQLPRQSAEELETYIRTSFDEMTAKKDELYKAVSGGEVDSQGLIDVLQELSGQKLDIGLVGLNRASPIAELLNLSTKKMVKPKGWKTGDDLVEETDDEIFARVSDFLEDVDYGDLYSFRGDLARIKNDLFKSTDAVQIATARDLNNIIKYIDEDALDYAARQNPTLQGSVDDAKSFYKDTYAPVWKDDGVLEEYARNYNIKKNLPELPAGTLDTNRTLLTDIIDNPKAVEQTNNIVNLLKTSEIEGITASVIPDYIIGNAAVKIKNLLARGKSFDDIEVSAVLDSLDQYGSTLSKNFPDETQRLQTFINELRSQKGTVAEITSQLDDAVALSKTIEDDIYNKKLKDFFDDRNIPIQSEGAYASLNTIMKRGDLNLIDDLLEYSKNDPIIKDALKASYAKTFRNDVLGSVTEFSGAKNLKTGAALKAQEELNNILATGKKIFADQPEIPAALESVLDVAYIITGNRRAKNIAGQSDTAMYTQAKQASDRAITYIFGVLNRIGARVRSGVTGVLGSLDSEIGQITDAVLADPDYFLEVANRIALNAEPSTLRKEVILPYLTRMYGITAQGEEGEIDLLNILAEVEQTLAESGNDVLEFIEEGVDEAQESFLK